MSAAPLSSKKSGSPLGEAVDNILNSLLQHSSPDLESTKALGDHPTAGRAFICAQLEIARQQETIKDVIVKLEIIKAAVNARREGFLQRTFTNDSEVRKQFIDMIDEKNKGFRKEAC